MSVILAPDSQLVVRVSNNRWLADELHELAYLIVSDITMVYHPCHNSINSVVRYLFSVLR
jgi:hypothetical protein